VAVTASASSTRLDVAVDARPVNLARDDLLERPVSNSADAALRRGSTLITPELAEQPERQRTTSLRPSR
jgi:hypothetical protein